MNKSTDSYTAQEYSSAFAVAKEALGFVAKFQTPPTPEVYEVWYRYAEGNDEALREALDYCVNDAKSVTPVQMKQVRQTFFSAAESAEANARLRDRLEGELVDLQSLVNNQLTATGEFDSSLGSVVSNLTSESSPSEARACIELAISCNDEMHRHLASVTTQLEESSGQLNEMRATFLASQKLLLVDPVTDVGNRRYFDTMMAQALESKSQEDCYRFLLIIDLDNFKGVNDTHGHSTGDRVLKYAAAKIQSIAQDASVARYGGDEFAVFIESKQQNEGQVLAESICEHFSQTTLKDIHTGLKVDKVTTSIGVARLRSDDDQESWFNRADKLLYSAKQGGRNRVMAERDFSDASASAVG